MRLMRFNFFFITKERRDIIGSSSEIEIQEIAIIVEKWTYSRLTLMYWITCLGKSYTWCDQKT